jgi:hypothetical protein
MKALLSNIFVIVYAAVTLFLRFFLEAQLQGRYLLSIAMGAFALLFLWALIRSGLISPTLMGLDRFSAKKK